MTKVTSSSTPIGMYRAISVISSIEAKQICDSARWRSQRARRLAAEEAADAESRIYEEREAENLRRESEAFLARQMDEMQALQEEQRKAGMLLEDGAPVKLNVSLAPAAPKTESAAKEKTAVVFGQDEEEEEGIRKRKVPLPQLDLAESGEKAKERLEKIKTLVPSDKETLFKSKVRWDGVTDVSFPANIFTLPPPDMSSDHDRPQIGAVDQTPDGQIFGRTRGRRPRHVRNRTPEGSQRSPKADRRPRTCAHWSHLLLSPMSNVYLHRSWRKKPASWSSACGVKLSSRVWRTEKACTRSA